MTLVYLWFCTRHYCEVCVDIKTELRTGHFGAVTRKFRISSSSFSASVLHFASIWLLLNVDLKRRHPVSGSDLLLFSVLI